MSDFIDISQVPNVNRRGGGRPPSETFRKMQQLPVNKAFAIPVEVREHETVEDAINRVRQPLYNLADRLAYRPKFVADPANGQIYVSRPNGSDYLMDENNQPRVEQIKRGDRVTIRRVTAADVAEPAVAADNE